MLAMRAMRATVQRMCMKKLPVCQPAASAGAAVAANATLQPRMGTVKQGIAPAKAPRQAPRHAPHHALAARRNIKIFIGQQWFSSAAIGMVDVSAEERAVAAVKITDVCAKRILKVQPTGFLRLRVDGGGCSGFQYKFELDTARQDEDVVFENGGAKLVIDETSLDLVRGSTIDFVEEMISSSFQVVNNPQSASSCGCGASFAPKA